ncbi:MAG: ubiquinol-cytochrome c reductase iron-sulfur subunit [Acidobacteriota bacterium]
MELERRDLLKKVASLLIGAISLFIPLGAGTKFLLDPLRRKSPEQGFIRVTSVDSLPMGMPRRFTVEGKRTDAWNTYEDEPIGSVYLIRRADKVDAFQVICPHAGCFVNYETTKRRFLCPCHGSSFRLDGSVAEAASPAPRGLDELDVEVQGNDVYVRYQKFQQGTKEKIALS